MTKMNKIILKLILQSVILGSKFFFVANVGLNGSDVIAYIPHIFVHLHHCIKLSNLLNIEYYIIVYN